MDHDQESADQNDTIEPFLLFIKVYLSSIWNSDGARGKQSDRQIRACGKDRLGYVEGIHICSLGSRKDVEKEEKNE